MKRNAIAIFLGFVGLMLANGLAYGGVLAPALHDIMARAPAGLTHEAFHYVLLGHFAQAVLLVGLWAKMGISSPKDGFLIGAALHFGMFTMFDSFVLSFLRLFEPLELVIDVFVNSITGGFGGLVIALVFQRMGTREAPISTT